MKTILGATLGLAGAAPMLASAAWGNYGDGYGMYGMTGYGGAITGGFGFFMVAGCLAWTVVGILAAVWLWQQINKK